MKVLLSFISALFLLLFCVSLLYAFLSSITFLYLSLAFFVLFLIFAVVSKILENQDITNDHLNYICNYIRYFEEKHKDNNNDIQIEENNDDNIEETNMKFF